MKKKPLDMPNIEQLEAELARTRYKSRYRSVLRSTVYTLIVVAAIAVLVATVWLPVLQIYGSSMTPTLDEEDIVISIKGSQFQQGDLIAFYDKGLHRKSSLLRGCYAFSGGGATEARSTSVTGIFSWRMGAFGCAMRSSRSFMATRPI